MTWHLDQATAEAYVRRTDDDVATASVEAHIVACTECQALVSTSVDPALDVLLADVWARIDDTLDRPRSSVTERGLLASGCSETTTRIITASARARWSYLTAVALSVALAIGAAQSGRDAAFVLFLLVAPIGPLIATAGAFASWADPLHALLRSLPTSPWRMALVRTVASVVPAIALTLISIPILDERGWLAAAWLLPALALSASTLALATWIPIEHATLAVGIAWLAIPMALRLRTYELLDIIGGGGQIAAAVVAVLAVVVVAVRRDTFEYRAIP